MHTSGAGVRGPRPELATLAAARAGEPQVVMVQGDGIGKSSLISEFLDGQRDLLAVAASGETAEAVLPYGVVQQLAAEAAAGSPGVLAGLELLLRGPGPYRR